MFEGEGRRARAVPLPLTQHHHVPLLLSEIDLAGTCDLLLFIQQHLLPLGEPARHPPKRKKNGEHIGGKSQRLVDSPE